MNTYDGRIVIIMISVIVDVVVDSVIGVIKKSLLAVSEWPERLARQITGDKISYLHDGR